ncbi:hypothetical protein QAD02_008106 [Eretmocerus hayati]|uniref:Uncharacterized protein n=1 Tax=Eretmocerus hayati TaxID=131215 RepID=A0ACC2N5K5_9HYME|nr:hypothetical protein QAD02_008106 [Eretmocerus hayati]
MAGDNLARGNLWFSFRPVNASFFGDLWGLIYKAVQSNANFNLDEPITIYSHYVTVQRGSGRVKLTHENVFKRSILRVRTDDNLCLPRAIATARIHSERDTERGKNNSLDQEWLQVQRYEGRYRTELAKKLVTDAGVRVPRSGCGVGEIRLQNYLANQSIAVAVYKSRGLDRGERPMFDGSELVIGLKGSIERTLRILYLERAKNYKPILNILKATGSQGYCTTCIKSYRYEDEHRCSEKCPCCLSRSKCDDSTMIKCDTCYRNSFGRECYERHLKPGTYRTIDKKKLSVCEGVYFCRECFKVVRLSHKNKIHGCGVGFCKICD